MEAPEKVYLGIEELDSGYVYNLSLENNGHAEYIRKEALIEWLKANLQDRDNWNEKSAADAYCELIDKLNEM